LRRSSISKTTKLKIFKTSVESILLYGCESWTLTKQISASIDGTYTRMLRAVQNVSWQQHLPNSVLYGALPPISTIIRQRRLRLAGHVYRHNEPASQVLLWNPEAPPTKRSSQHDPENINRARNWSEWSISFQHYARQGQLGPTHQVIMKNEWMKKNNNRTWQPMQWLGKPESNLLSKPVFLGGQS